MEPITVVIPANYTEAGKILGLFELRKLVEAAVLCIPLLALFLFCLPFAITANIIVSAVVVVPLGGFAIMGIHDYSLLNFIRVERKWRRERKILTFSGEISVEKKLREPLTFKGIYDKMGLGKRRDK